MPRAALSDIVPSGQASMADVVPEAPAGPPMPDMSSVKEGQGKTFMDGPFKGQTWALKDGQPYQIQPGNDRTRPDNSVLGMPPELGVVAGLGIKAATGLATGVAGKAKAAAGATWEGVGSPMMKYSATKIALTSMGVPEWVAEMLAAGASGVRRGGKGAPPVAAEVKAATAVVPEAEAVAAASPVAPVASAPVSPEPGAGPSAPSPAPPSPVAPRSIVMSPQRIQNELGLAARRQKVKLTEPQYQQAAELVGAGKSPTEAVQAVQAAQPPTPAKLKMTADQVKAYYSLRNQGKSDAEAMKALLAQVELAKALGTPSGEAVRTAVAQRNASGRWPAPVE